MPRTTTVRAVRVEFYSLGCAHVQEVFARSADVRAALSGAGDARYLETQNWLLMRL